MEEISIPLTCSSCSNLFDPGYKSRTPVLHRGIWIITHSHKFLFLRSVDNIRGYETERYIYG